MRLPKDAKVSLLGKIPLFERCSKHQLARIASIARETRYPPATPVVRKGEQGTDFFVVVEGEADVRSGARKLATLRQGSVFGELALLPGARQTATVTTGTPMRALVISRRAFRTLLQDPPGLQFKLLQEVGTRLERLSSEQAHQRIRL